MNERTEHTYSTFALDVHVASGRIDAAIEAHLQACERCRGYVEGLSALASPPAWNPVARSTPKPKGRWLVLAAGVTAVAAGTLLWVRTKPSNEEAYVGVKGTPATQLLVRRDGRVAIWDGASHVRPGDALALRVACEGYAHVTVTTPAGDAKPARLFEGACVTSSAPLPFTLVVDEKPGDERFTVVLSAARLDDAALARVTTAGAGASAGVWVVPFLLHKGSP